MSNAPAHERDEAILDLLDGSLPEDSQAELRRWLDESPEHWGRFVELSFVHSQIAEQLHSQRSSDGVRLGALHAEPADQELPPIHLESSTPLTRQQYASALSYVLRHTFTPKRIAVLATAAVLLLGVVLTIVFLTGGPNDTEQIVVRPENPGQPGSTGDRIDAPAIVATLTGERDAVWDRQPGEDLSAGQRLTLAQGFAEITTNRGAVAILEAPATIELIDSPNALRLHAGKLVGICETESSKGFLVRTPHMDVIDLGTRFGIDASRADTTEVHVFEGEVKARAGNASIGTTATLLVAGQSAQNSAASGEIVTIRHAAERFVVSLPLAIERPGTGHGVPVGQADPRWVIIERQGESLSTPIPLFVFEDPRTRHLGPQAAQWIGALTNETDSRPPMPRYGIQARLSLPASPIAGDSALLLEFLADNSLVSLTVNGKQVVVPDNELDLSRPEPYSLRIDRSHLIEGENVFRFEILNNPAQENYVGIRAHWRFVPDGQGN